MLTRMRGLFRCGLLWSALLLLSATPLLAQSQKGLERIQTTSAERRMALVIGNAAYQHTASLRNSVNDARDMAQALRSLGFQVLLKTDVTLDTMADAVFQFGE